MGSESPEHDDFLLVLRDIRFALRALVVLLLFIVLAMTLWVSP